MKFRYAAQVQRALIDNESILDISSELTRINCQIDSMQSVRISRNQVDIEALQALIDFHQMDSTRREKWQTYLQTT